MPQSVKITHATGYNLLFSLFALLTCRTYLAPKVNLFSSLFFATTTTTTSATLREERGSSPTQVTIFQLFFSFFEGEILLFGYLVRVCHLDREWEVITWIITTRKKNTNLASFLSFSLLSFEQLISHTFLSNENKQTNTTTNTATTTILYTLTRVNNLLQRN